MIIVLESLCLLTVFRCTFSIVLNSAFSVIVKTDGPFSALMITYIRDSDPSIFSNNNADVDIYFVILYSVIFIGYVLLRLKTAWGWGCYQDNDEV